MSSRLSRRNFLRTTGASAAALMPLLNLGRASAAASPKRVILCTWTNGFYRPELWPVGEGTDFTLGKILQPLEPYKSKMLVVGGLKMQNFLDTKGAKKPDVGSGHDGYPCLYVGEPMSTYADFNEKAGGDSVDQYLADRIMGTPVKNLVVGVQTGSGYNGTTSYRGSGSTGVTPENDPFRLYKTLFAGRTLDKGQIDKIMLRRQSVLDFLGKDVDAFAQRVGTDDRQKIQAHADSIREIEKQLVALANGPRCASPDTGPAFGVSDNDSFPKVLRLHTDLLVAALRCNLTRIVNFAMEDSAGDIVFSWLGQEFAGAGDEFPTRTHHDIAHNSKRSDAHNNRYIRVSQWFFEQVAYLCKQLAATPEGSGSMLDNSVVVVSTTMAQNHTIIGIPVVMIGSCGGYFKTGRLIKLAGWKGVGGGYFSASLSPTANDMVPHNGVLVALCNAMGVPTEHFGPAQYGGELTELRG